jgi:AraC-like DNA-binding protein
MITENITRDKLYQDHKISLVKLSRGLSLKPHIVSQVINDQLSCNFNDLINSYRIEDAKEMLHDPGKNNITIASIAYDCGFNTLSAFNTAFRKFTKMTPSQFRNKV